MEIGEELFEALRLAVPQWAQRVVVERGGTDLAAAGRESGRLGFVDIEEDMRALLFADIDAQRGTPLSLLRRLVDRPTAVLRDAGVAAVQRDPYDEELFPDDVYALTPAAFSDFGDEVGEIGLRWSVAKAWEHKRRHQP